MPALALLASTTNRVVRARCARKQTRRTQSIASSFPAQRASPFRIARKKLLSVCQQAGQPAFSPLTTLAASKPLDRIRGQAKVVFDFYDLDKDGLLKAAELTSYTTAVDARPFGDELKAILKQVASQLTADKGPDTTYDFEQFEWLYRQQCERVKQNARVYLAGYFNPAEVEKTKFEATLKDEEFATAHWAFQSMDLSQSGSVPVAVLQRIPGIEGEIVQAKVLEEVEGDGVTFSDYLNSYAKPKPVFLNMAILIAHTAVMWCILQLPIELMIKGVLIAVVFIQPQIVTNAVIYVYNIVTTVINNIRANLEVNGSGFTRFA